MTSWSRGCPPRDARRGSVGANVLGFAALLGACSAEDVLLATEPTPEEAALASPAAAPVPGFADLHLHMLAEEAFGGAWMHGDVRGLPASCDGGFPPSDHGRVRQDLSALSGSCPLPQALAGTPLGNAFLGIGGAVLSEEIGKTAGTEGDTGLHLHRKEHGAGHPSWDTVAHHQATVAGLQQAHARGLNLVVLSTVSFDWLCRLTPLENRKRPECNEMADVEAQLELAHKLDAELEWFEIVLTPAQARTAIAAGRLAVVLSVEASHIFGYPNEPWQPLFDRFYDLGVRTLQPVHQLDNRFAGAALHNAVFQIAQYTENCHVDTDCGVTTKELTLGFDVEKNARGECRNSKGLTTEGEQLLTRMMERGMPIDVAHMSEKAIERSYELASAHHFYPLYVSHGHFREIMADEQAAQEKTTPSWVIERLRRTGGMFGLRTFHEESRSYGRSDVEANCQGSTRSFAQAYDFGRLGLKVPLALGSDLNGFIQQTRPRFGADACSATKWDRGLSTFTPFEAQAQCEARDQAEQGARLGSEFDERGLAHVALLPDLIADLAQLGADTEPLGRSAETYLRMWERAQTARAGAADAASDIDLSGISDLPSHEQREADYPSKCDKHYCSGHQVLGGVCRFDAECQTGLCSSTALCGLPEGVCVCNGDDDCGAGSRCAVGVPALAADNHCEALRGDHEACSADSMCASGACGGCAELIGFCYTPESKGIGEDCRADDECKSARCSADCYVNPQGRCLCDADSDCGAGEYCGYAANSGSCRPKRSTGESCLYGRECSSGNCGLTWRGTRCK